MHLKICPQCHKEFTTKHKEQICCSGICAQAPRKCLPKTCPQCSKDFSPRVNVQIFCSRDCLRASTKIPTRLCQQCHKEFSTKHKHVLCCSNKCAGALRMAHHPVMTCFTCKNNFIRPQSGAQAKYCSKECMAIAFRKRELFTCATCGEQDERVIGTERKYCSNPCRNKASLGRVPGNKKTWVSIVCETCGKTFEVVPARAAAKFCSRECHYVARRLIRGTEHWLFIAEAHVTQKCACCGKLFAVKRAKVLMGEGRFCSRQCVGAYVTGLQQGRRSSLEVLMEEALKVLEEPFFAQMPLGPWIADFFLPRYNLVLECDGVYWHGKPDVARRDRQKDGWMRRHRYKIIRLLEPDIRNDSLGILREALASMPLA